jgi:hypothetical protein
MRQRSRVRTTHRVDALGDPATGAVAEILVQLTGFLATAADVRREVAT